MGYEGIAEQKPRPAIAETSPAETKESVYAKLDSLETQYRVRVWEGKTPSTETIPKGERLSSYLHDCYILQPLISDAFYTNTRKHSWQLPDTYQSFTQCVLDAVDASYAPEDTSFIPRLPSIVSKVGESFSAAEIGEKVVEDRVPEEMPPQDRRGPFHAGLIGYAVFNGKLFPDFPQISAEDEVVEIHVTPLAEQVENDEISAVNIFSQDSFRELATSIKENSPNAKYIIGRSWLMDTPIARRVGFSVADDSDAYPSGLMFWGQFIDQKGNVKEKEYADFLETGVAPHQVKLGYIKVADFLKKYG